MAKAAMKQFRFYNLNNPQNEPAVDSTNLAECVWVNGLFDNYPAIVKIGIQTLPGVKFNFTAEAHNPQTDITIDYTGIYELDLRNVSATIQTISFNPDSLALINSIDNASLIVDIAYASDQG